MSDTTNPYQPPEHRPQPVDYAENGYSLSPDMAGCLKKASPWMSFLGVIGFVGSGILAFLGITTVLGFNAASAALGAFEDINPSLNGNFTSFVGGIVGIIYIGAAVLVFFPALFTFRMGKRINTWVYTNESSALHGALKNNLNYWKFTGILAIVNLLALPVLIVVIIIFTVVNGLE